MNPAETNWKPDRDGQERWDRERLILNLAIRFINLPPTKIDEALQEALAVVGTFTRSDRCYLNLYDFKEKIMANLFEWCAQGITPEHETQLRIPFCSLPEVVQAHRRGELFFVPLVKALSPDQALRRYLEGQNVFSMIMLPMMNGTECLGFVGFDSVRKPRTWSEEEISLLRILAELFTNAEQRRRYEETLAQERLRTETLIETLPDTNIYFKDRSGRFLRVNQAQARTLGVNHPDQALGKTDHDFFTKEHVRWAKEDEDRVMRTGIPLVGRVERIGSAGEYRWVSTTKVPMRGMGGEIIGTMGITRDITSLKSTEEALRLRESQLWAIIDNQLGLIVLKDCEGRILIVNNAFCRSFGLNDPKQAVGKSDYEFHPPDLAEKYRLDDQEVMRTGKPLVVEETILDRGERKTFETSKSPIRNEQGEILGVTVFCRDITERKKAEERIWALSFRDHLTGLYNRAFFEEEFHRLGNSRELPFAIILADVNGLKLVNDAFGHDRGDELLIRFAAALTQTFRKEDIVSRWGGDEFIVLLPHSNPSVIEEVIARLHHACREAASDQLPLSVSAGYAMKEDPDTPLDRVIREAEERMYQHKLAESRRTHQAIIAFLEGSLQVSARETEAHVHQVRRLARAIGSALPLPESALNDLELSARLHDLGKIAIPARILDKPGPLNPSEWETMQTHPTIGYRITKSSPDLSRIAEVILAHHERWDGTGYPQRLKGEAIPLLARIIAIADAYDIMTRGRPYRKRIAKAAARQELTRSSGSQFDPRLVNLFLSLPDIK
ncbi:MAG TPA: PAS domain-containing protein [Atribacteraceae bacterium]|nr:PAS domain-containing protein [Atribacteraceae bacterium]